MSGWNIERLGKRHERKGFDCGVESLSAFPHQYAAQNDRKGISRTYVATKENSVDVAGYFTLFGSVLDITELPEKLSRHLPRYSVPVVVLGRLAVDLRFQGQGLGGILLACALERIVDASELIGVYGAVADAVDDKAREFYLAHDFVPLTDDPYHLLLPIAMVKRV